MQINPGVLHLPHQNNPHQAAVFDHQAAITPAGRVMVGMHLAGGISRAYQTTGNNISFGPMLATQKACSDPANVMEQESQYLAALASATSFQIQGQSLEMQNANGETAVQFQRVGP
jgi:heat shock protein HslJ